MNPSPVAAGAEISFSDVNSFPLDGEAALRASLVHDKPLLLGLELAHSNLPARDSNETGPHFINAELAEYARDTYDAETQSSLELFLADKGTIDIPVVRGYTVVVDGIERAVSIVTATESDADGANHGDMSSMLYLRDQIQAASALIELSLQDPNRYGEEGKVGKELLISALHLMSTSSQLERFNRVIQLGEQAGQADWPQISLHFNDLEGTQPNNWRNKQDSFQMLAYMTLDAIERGFLSVDELSESHKKFLASIVPLLESVNFPNYENSGSWEEITAVRTSVTAIETALLHKMKTLTEKDGALSFLAERYENEPIGFKETLDDMLQNGLQKLGRQLPYESPDYEPGSIKLRKSDAALVYVLRYDIPRLLADNRTLIAANGDKPMSAEAIECMVLDQLSELIDLEAGGVIRYPEDSYQRVNFHTDTVQSIIKSIKHKVQYDAKPHDGEVDLDEKQSLRGRLTPAGKPAAWTHPLSQIASWAANRSISAAREQGGAQAARYRELSAQFLNAALSTVTSENQWHAVLNGDGRYHLKQVPAYRLPECYVAYETPTGATFRVPSPHTPLNWSSAMLKEAVGLIGVSLRS